MQKIVNFFRGSALLIVTGAYPERFLNLCARSGAAFWDLTWVNDYSLTLRVARKDVCRVCALAEKLMCEVETEGRFGLPFFLRGFRRRYALWAGLALSLLAVLLCSRTILTIDVTGNQRVSTAEIRRELARAGVKIGAYGPQIDQRGAANRALLQLPELSWLAVNLHGTRAEVIAREKRPKPTLLDTTTPSHVVATATGIVTKVEALDGQAMFRPGDTVVEGDILISGIMDIAEPKWSETDLGVRVVHAMGSVTARTWRTLKAEMPLTAPVKRPTGETKTGWSLHILETRVNIFGNSGISGGKYDKITTTYRMRLPGGRTLPLALVAERRSDYDTVPEPLDRTAAEAILRAGLKRRLAELVPAGEVLKQDFVSGQTGGMLTMTLLAECREEIGQVVPFEGHLGIRPPG